MNNKQNIQQMNQSQLLRYASDLKTTYNELLKKQHTLEALNNKKKDFLNMLSHEFRTPISIIYEVSDLMNDKTLGEHQRDELLKILKATSKNLISLLEKILAAGKKDQYTIKQTFQTFNLLELFTHLTKTLDFFLSKRKQKLIISVETDTKNIIIKGDKDRLFDTFFNIIQNASKFSPDETSICVRIKQKNNTVVIDIEDQGIGIDKKEFEAIFLPFYQVIDVMQHHSGEFEFQSSQLGMGLTIAKEIIVQHKGTIAVKSELNKGSTFTIKLPCKGE